ncbi:MAG: DUF2125 domain-containing protein [Pseudomonadota bacterium]
MTVESGRRVSRLWLYFPVAVFALLIAAYSTYWFWMRGEIDKGIDAWIDDQRELGMTIEFKEKRIDGFPYRFALSVDDPQISDPGSGINWSGQELQLIMQPWDFNHLIGRSPGRNSLMLNGEVPVTATLGPKSVASLTWNAVSVERFALSLDEADIVLAEGSTRVTDLALNLGYADGSLEKLRIALDVSELVLPKAPAEAEWLERTIENFRVRLELANPQSFILRQMPSPALLPDSSANLAQLLVNWGPLKLGAKGDLVLPYDTCAPDGVLNFRLEDTGPLVAALDNAGQLTDEIQTGIDAVAAVSNTGGFAPITFRNGRITFLGQSVAELPPLCGDARAIPVN